MVRLVLDVVVTLINHVLLEHLLLLLLVLLMGQSGRLRLAHKGIHLLVDESLTIAMAAHTSSFSDKFRCSVHDCLLLCEMQLV